MIRQVILQGRSLHGCAVALGLAIVTSPISLAGQLPFNQDAHVGVSITTNVGLDPATRQLIEQFIPKNVREEFLKTLASALPMIKQSLDDVLDEVNSSAEKQILNLQCAADGTVAEIGAHRIFTRVQDPIEDFRAHEKDRLGAFTLTSGPEQYLDVYNDLYYRAKVAYCQMKLNGSAKRAEEIEDHYRQLTLIWERVKDSCNGAVDCVDTAHKATQALIERSDPQDVRYVDGQRKIAEIAVPAAPTTYQRAKQSLSFSTFSPKPYEEDIKKLLDLQDRLLLARARREYMAAVLMKSAEDGLDPLRTITEKAEEGCHGDERDEAEKGLRAAIDALTEVSSASSKAYQLDPAHQSETFNRLDPELRRISRDIDAAHSLCETIEP